MHKNDAAPIEACLVKCIRLLEGDLLNPTFLMHTFFFFFWKSNLDF